MSEEIAKQYAEKIDALYKQTSALQGNGIKELFNEAGKKYLETIGETIIVNKENKVKKLNKVSKENDKRKNCC